MATPKKVNSDSIAVIQLAGKQFVVKTGDKIETEKLEAKVGDTISVTEVLLVNDGLETKVGTPFLDGATVSLTLNRTDKADKIEIRKFKAKSRYRRTTGHRQTTSHLTVTGISQK